MDAIIWSQKCHCRYHASSFAPFDQDQTFSLVWSLILFLLRCLKRKKSSNMRLTINWRFISRHRITTRVSINYSRCINWPTEAINLHFSSPFATRNARYRAQIQQCIQVNLIKSIENFYFPLLEVAGRNKKLYRR